MPAPVCPVARAVADALRDGEAAYAARGIMVSVALDPDAGLRTRDDIVYRAVYTIFRGLPERLADGATLRISTLARAGGDVELAWGSLENDARAAHPMGLTPAEALARGPYGDLFEIAVLALENVCRARGGLVEIPDEGASSSAFHHERAVRRRYLFLIPSLERARYPGSVAEAHEA